MAVQLKLYTRTGCHLCEDMAQALAEQAGRLHFTVEAIDIDEDASLVTGYGNRVPVLMLAETLICEYFLDLQALQQALSEHTHD